MFRADANILAYPSTNKECNGNRLEHDQTSNNDFHLIWCDKFIKTDPNEDQHTLSHLRIVTKHVITFTDEKGCLKYIDDFQETNKLFLIVSGSLGEGLIPCIHHREQIRSIYVFCQRKSIHEVWARNYAKIKGVFDQVTQLRQVLEMDKQQLEDERLSQIIVDSVQKCVPWPTNFDQLSNIKNSKSNDEDESIEKLKTSMTSVIISPSQEVNIDRNLPCSHTVAPYTHHKQQMEFADTGKNMRTFAVILIRLF